CCAVARLRARLRPRRSSCSPTSRSRATSRPCAAASADGMPPGDCRAARALRPTRSTRRSASATRARCGAASMAGAAPERGGAAGARPRVLFVSADPVGETMAGLGIRCWELARALAPLASVTVGHGGTEQGEHDGVRMLPFRPHAPGALRESIARADVVVAHPQWPLVDSWLRRSAARVVIDLYCPETLETLELAASSSRLQRGQLTATTLDRLHSALRTGHNFVCASETQR